MRNDKERFEFVRNPENWETIGNLNNIIRLRSLCYEYEEWYALEIRQIVPQFFNGMKSFTAAWNRIGIFQINDDVRAFTFGYSEKDIVDVIRKTDRGKKK